MQFQPVYKLTVCEVDGSKIIKMNMKSMSHTYDVIDMYINIGVQKTFARPHFKLVHGISILIKKLVPLGQNSELQCIHIHRSL